MSALNCLVAVCVGPGMPESISQRMRAGVESLRCGNPAWGVAIVYYDAVAQERPKPGPRWTEVHARNMARIRNQLLDEHLTGVYSHVLWLDADIVTIPDNLIERLYALNPTGITAPLPLIEKTWNLYDTYCLLDSDQQRPSAASPYWRGNIPHREHVPIWSAGCCYLTPAAVHRAGGRFTPTHAPPGEHRGVFEQAHAMQLPCVVDCVTVVEHADLPRHGMVWH